MHLLSDGSSQLRATTVAVLLVLFSCTVDCDDIKAILVCNLYVIDNTERYVKMNSDVHAISICIHKVTTVLLVLFLIMATGRFVELLKLVSLNLD